MICQLGYDVEHEAIVFGDSKLQSGDTLSVLIPSPTSGELVWTPVRIVWESRPSQRWRFISADLEVNPILETCNPVGLFAKK